MGKAKSLRSRLQSYVPNLKHHTLKTRKLIAHINDIDTIIVKSEVEALLLERRLIRTHQPRFNILLRDDKNYPYLKVDFKQPWPRLLVVRQRIDDGAQYFGPFSCQQSLWSTYELVHRTFPLVRCSTYEFETTKRPCNYHSMKLCWAPCHKKVDSAAYHSMMRDVIDIIKGKGQASFKKKLKDKMIKAAEDENYLLAARYRNQITALDNVTKLHNSTYAKTASCDALGWHGSPEIISIHVLSVRDHLLSGSQGFLIDNPLGETPQHIITQFLAQYYATRPLPRLIISPFDLGDQKALLESLGTSPHKVKIREEHYIEEQDLMKTAHKNAQLAFKNSLNQTQTHGSFLKKVTQELPHPLNLERIECYDISHLSGTATVASGVCFVNGKPDKSGYRKYNIKTSALPASSSPTLSQRTGAPEGAVVVHGDDYGALREVIKRRLAKIGTTNGHNTEDNTENKKKNQPQPTLIVIDGGKGQLSSVLEVRNREFPDIAVPFIAMAKAKNHADNHERLFFENQSDGFILEPGTAGFRLFTQIRDEAHRFAITHHRQRRTKVRHRSSLEDIPGVGVTLRKRLLEHFSSLNSLNEASCKDISEVRGVSAALAQVIYNHLRGLHQSQPSPELSQKKL